MYFFFLVGLTEPKTRSCTVDVQTIEKRNASSQLRHNEMFIGLAKEPILILIIIIIIVIIIIIIIITIVDDDDDDDNEWRRRWWWWWQ